MSVLRFNVSLGSKDWRSSARAYHCTPLRLPGADVSAIYSAGAIVDKDSYKVQRKEQWIRFPSWDSPRDILVTIELKFRLVLQRWAVIITAATTLVASGISGGLSYMGSRQNAQDELRDCESKRKECTAALREAQSGAKTTTSVPPQQTKSTGSTRTRPQGNELEIARRIEGLVKEKKYSEAADSFSDLRKAHFSGVGYSAYPEAAVAFSKLGDIEGALRVLDFLSARLAEDTAKGRGYLAPGRPPRRFLRDDFKRLRSEVADPAVRKRIAEIESEL